jgi:predicted porin
MSTKLPLAAAALAAACQALPVAAQTTSNVTLYGIVDLAVRHASGLGADNLPSPASTSMLNSGVGPISRWGLRGSEDLGGGLKAGFNLETGFNADTGVLSNSSKLFDRAATVSLTAPWGGLVLGHQNHLVTDSAGLVDPIGSRFVPLNPNVQLTSLAGHRLGIQFGTTGSPLAANRLDNAVRAVAKLGAASVQAMYSFGEIGGSNKALSSRGLGADYSGGPLRLTAAFMQLHDADGRSLDTYNVGGSWDFSGTRVMLNLGRHRGETSATTETAQRIIAGGVNMPLTPAIDLIAGYYKVDRDRTGLADDGFGRLITFVEYKLSKRSKAYVELDHTRWRNGYQGAGNKDRATGVSLGMTHNF